MQKKLIQFIPITLTLLAIGFGEFSRWCSAEGHACNRTVVDQMIPYVTYPLYFFALYSIPLAIILIFVSRTVFVSWWKVAGLLLVITFLFVAGTPVYPQSFLSTDRDDAARFAAEVFTALSLVLIAWKYFTLRGLKK